MLYDCCGDFQVEFLGLEQNASHRVREKCSGTRFERYRNAYRPHQAPGQPLPMQAHSQHFDQNAIAN